MLLLDWIKVLMIVDVTKLWHLLSLRHFGFTVGAPFLVFIQDFIRYGLRTLP